MVYGLCGGDCFLFFKQKTAYELRISDWSSDVCSSDLTRTVCPLLNHGTYRFTLNCLDPVKKQMPAIQHGNWQQIDEPQVNGDHSHEEDEILQAAIDLLAGNLSDFQRQIGRAHVCTSVTNAHLVCSLLLEKTKEQKNDTL